MEQKEQAQHNSLQEEAFCVEGCGLAVPVVPPQRTPLVWGARLFTAHKLGHFEGLSLKPYPIATPGKPEVQLDLAGRGQQRPA